MFTQKLKHGIISLVWYGALLSFIQSQFSYAQIEKPEFKLSKNNIKIIHCDFYFPRKNSPLDLKDVTDCQQKVKYDHIIFATVYEGRSSHSKIEKNYDLSIKHANEVKNVFSKSVEAQVFIKYAGNIHDANRHTSLTIIEVKDLDSFLKENQKTPEKKEEVKEVREVEKKCSAECQGAGVDFDIGGGVQFVATKPMSDLVQRTMPSFHFGIRKSLVALEDGLDFYIGGETELAKGTRNLDTTQGNGTAKVIYDRKDFLILFGLERKFFNFFSLFIESGVGIHDRTLILTFDDTSKS